LGWSGDQGGSEPLSGVGTRRVPTPLEGSDPSWSPLQPN